MNKKVDIKEVREKMKLIYAVTENIFNVKLDFTPNSLSKLEDAIDKHYPLGHKPTVGLLVPFGFYLGETIINNSLNAEWGDLDEHPFDWTITLKHGKGEIRLNPVRRVNNFWHDRTDGLYPWYKMVFDMLSGKIKPNTEKKSEWSEWDNRDNYKIRTKSIKIDNLDEKGLEKLKKQYNLSDKQVDEIKK